MENLEQFCPVWWHYSVRRWDSKLQIFIRYLTLYLKLPLSSRGVQEFFRAMRALSTLEPDGEPMHRNLPEPAGRPVELGLTVARNHLHSGCLPLVRCFFFLCGVFFLVPLLQGRNEHKLTTFCVHFNSARLGCLGDFTILPLQPALCYVR